MKKTSNRTPVIILVAVTTLAIAIVLLAFASPFLVIVFEDHFTKKSIDNEYIDRKYTDWHTESIKGFGSFKIPNNWTLEADSPVYKLISETGDIVAHGALFNTEVDAFQKYSEFYASFCGFTPTGQFSSYPLESINMQGSSFYLHTIYRDEQELEFCCVNLSDGIHARLILAFSSKLDRNEMFEIAEAIVYSYAYVCN